MSISQHQEDGAKNCMFDKLRNYLLLGAEEGQVDLIRLSRISALRIFTVTSH